MQDRKEHDFGAARVSIVIPTHHRPTQLGRLLDSLQKQVYPLELIEVIVVASERDKAFEFVENFRRRDILKIRCVTLRDDPWRGRSTSAKRNYGVQLATGQWIAFADDDCIADPHWISGAVRWMDDPTVVAIEGRTATPSPGGRTAVYKGMISFRRSGGFQTCNMFFRRDTFLDVGGFDTEFPFYLEDTDLAWTIMDRGYSIPFAEDAVVYHPIPDPQPWRLCDDAKRTILLPYLFKKHPERFRQCRIRALRASHWTYLTCYAVLLLSMGFAYWLAAAASLALVVIVVGCHVTKWFWGCAARWHEVLVTAFLLPIVPVVRLVQVARGNVLYGVFLWR